MTWVGEVGVDVAARRHDLDILVSWERMNQKEILERDEIGIKRA